MNKIISIFIFTLLMSLSVFSSECFIVSGIEIDIFPVVRKDLLRLEHTINGSICKVVKGWANLSQTIEELEKTSKLKKGDKILIVQEAHGGPGGSAVCDAGTTEGDDVLATLNKLARTYSVAAFLNTCFSADLLRKKLIQDKIKSEEQTLKNLCLVTASYFGRMSSVSDATFTFFSPIFSGLKFSSIDELFKLYGLAGLISSAAWDSSGATDYLAYAHSKNPNDEEKIRLGKKALSNIRDMVSNSQEWRQNAAKQVIDIILAPVVDNQKLASLFHYVKKAEVVVPTMVEILDSIFGLRFLPGEIDKNWKLPSPHTDSVLSPVAVLNGLMHESLRTHGNFANNDILRREACRNFSISSESHLNTPSNLHRGFNFKDTPLDFAILTDNKEVKKRLVAAGAQIKYKHAAWMGFELLELASKLQPSALEARDEYKKTIIDYLLENLQAKNIVKELIEKLPFLLLQKNEDNQSVAKRIYMIFPDLYQTHGQKIIDANPQVLTEEDNKGNTLAHSTFILPELLDLYINNAPKIFSKKNKEGNTPLHINASSSRPAFEKIVQRVPEGALKEVDVSSNTPIHIAAQNSWWNIVELALEKVPNIFLIPNKFGKTIRDIANDSISEAQRTDGTLKERMQRKNARAPDSLMEKLESI